MASSSLRSSNAKDVQPLQNHSGLQLTYKPDRTHDSANARQNSLPNPRTAPVTIQTCYLNNNRHLSVTYSFNINHLNTLFSNEKDANVLGLCVCIDCIIVESSDASLRTVESRFKICGSEILKCGVFKLRSRAENEIEPNDASKV